MNRRDFLAIAGALGLVGCGGGSAGDDAPDRGTPPPPPGNPAAPLPVVVIGAGIAGLTAARKLVQAGRNVIVLEARARTGGRLHTSSKWQDAPLDLGATWIHGDSAANPVAALATQVNARTTLTSFSSSRAFGTDGNVLSSDEIDRVAALRSEVRQAATRLQDSENDLPLLDAIYRGANYTNRPTAERELIDYLINTMYEHEYSGAANQLSTLWFDSGSRFDGGERLFLDGYRVLTDHLAAGLEIRLEHVVTSVNYGEKAVTINTNKGQVAASAVVVTLPLGVLQSGQVTFDPPLPLKKQQAITKLGMGVLNKCFLRFPTTFWDPAADWINYIPAGSQNGQWAEWVSFARPTGKPILLGFNAAAFGAQIETWSDEDIVADAMRTLTAMYGTGIPAPVDWQITRWGADPYTRGAYSYNKFGSAPVMRDDLASSVDGLLYFAGEATERKHYQTVQGALLSGQRAANEVLAAGT